MKKRLLLTPVILGLLFLMATVSSVYGQNKSNGKATQNFIAANWKLGIQMWTFRLFTQQEALEKADSAGIRYIEATIGQKIDKSGKEAFGIDMTAADKAKLKGLLAKHKAQIVAMGVINPPNRASWIKTFDLAKEFGLSYIISEPPKNQWDLIDSLAGFYKIKVAIHEHANPNPYWHPDSVLAAIKGHSNIGACADLGHWARSGLDPAECLKKLEGHVIGVHLKDIVTFGVRKAADATVGKGVINFAPIFEELNRQKFKGMLSIEHESNWENNLPDVIETVNFYNDQVKKLK